MPETKPQDVSEEVVATVKEQLDTMFEGMSGEEVLTALQGLRDEIADRMDDVLVELLYGETDGDADEHNDEVAGG